jgi:ribosomal protein S1
MMRGENKQHTYRLGDKVNVRVLRVNMDSRQIDLGLVDILERVKEGERGVRRWKARPKNEHPGKRIRPGRRERAGRKGKRR